jgi:dipeptidyl aminopeptidase/acylaminoacyl peptidase
MSSEHTGIHVGSLDSNETRHLLRSESRGLYARGHLLYRLGTTLMARKFDLSTLELADDPTPIATDVTGGAISWGGAQFGVAETDVLVHLQGMEGSLSVLTWRDRDGILLDTLGEPVGYWDPAISHDGSRLAVGLGVDTVDLWIYDLEQDTQTRVTFDPFEHRNPVWSPDDTQLAFLSSREAEGEIWVRSTSGHGGEKRLFTANTDIVLTDWSSDGRLIFFTYLERSDDSMDIWTLDVETAEAKPLISGEPEQLAARQSPDGKWLAFVSDESGNSEVYVQTFPNADERWMVSSDGGARWAWNPIWRNDGRELYFLRGRTVMAVPVTVGAGFPFGAPRPLFAAPVKSNQGNIYAVSQDGQRILTNELPPADPTKAGARLIQGWSELASR